MALVPLGSWLDRDEANYDQVLSKLKSGSPVQKLYLEYMEAAATVRVQLLQEWSREQRLETMPTGGIADTLHTLSDKSVKLRRWKLRNAYARLKDHIERTFPIRGNDAEWRREEVQEITEKARKWLTHEYNKTWASTKKEQPKATPGYIEEEEEEEQGTPPKGQEIDSLPPTKDYASWDPRSAIWKEIWPTELWIWLYPRLESIVKELYPEPDGEERPPLGPPLLAAKKYVRRKLHANGMKHADITKLGIQPKQEYTAEGEKIKGFFDEMPGLLDAMNDATRFKPIDEKKRTEKTAGGIGDFFVGERLDENVQKVTLKDDVGAIIRTHRWTFIYYDSTDVGHRVYNAIRRSYNSMAFSLRGNMSIAFLHYDMDNASLAKTGYDTQKKGQFVFVHGPKKFGTVSAGFETQQLDKTVDGFYLDSYGKKEYQQLHYITPLQNFIVTQVTNAKRY